MIPVEDGPVEGWSDRQRDVLEATLDLIVKGQRPLSMIAVARSASCSKETLYRWFGDRDGLLTATVRWQAAKVRGIELPNGPIDRAFLEDALTRFAKDWLRVLSGPTSVALNRLAIAEAGSETLDLGAIVLRNGPAEMARRIAPLFVAARASGLVRYSDDGNAFSTFFGLVVGDLQIRLLLGDDSIGDIDLDRAAEQAAGRFMILYGSPTRGD
ncbi:TetR/AcrR family transcriptional regulator C-terminal domain-containing protein [Fulvimarina sp. 2208YS6-2-32]|uniref:TetR/AcrR family transcriptional regulator C-terminal domain-containing protein n=1 Tax=Fulvimarina uroteuthidis TaxID=3098149 RepID=A0ABU5I537_9HYPH|nr:TetR/AcrR family transcriptional regulator C-terminal domain-containing protein [Fulvimarina sp. 2208YS6-2-32]MDY8110489.1 TetR/AcrR family transcriptional regulator C-terminal domain-containing protein [Fulvimarina sp. 2208YS6-2-32]